MYSDAILTWFASIPGIEATLADSSENMGSRYDEVIDFPES